MACLWRNVQKKIHTKKWEDCRGRRTSVWGFSLENTRAKEVSVSVRGRCSIERRPKQPEEETHHKHQSTHSGCQESWCYMCYSLRSAAADSQIAGESGKRRRRRREKRPHTNIVAKLGKKMVSNLQESQLELNCESGITLYIKKKQKKKRRQQSHSISSRCFFPPSVLIYDLV